MRYLFAIVWGFVVLLLLAVSFVFKDERTAVVAQVEPERMSVSFHKPVRILNIHVLPGQKVKKGDKMIEVERPDLQLDLDRSLNQLGSLNVELQNLDDRLRSDLRFLDLERLRETEIIKGKILRLRSELAISEDLFNDFASLNATSGRSTADSLAIIDLELLDQSLKGVEEYHKAEKLRLQNVYEESKRSLSERIILQEKEISLLRSEEIELVQLAPFDGTIGNVYVEKDEVIDAFVNILSVYEENPSIIKAFMDEQQSYQIQLGQNVVVESANREYSEMGEVIEIGSRIIQYPTRLSGVTPMYGQEIFVRIPASNQFLNGERVRVLID